MREPVDRPGDLDSAPWWDGLDRGELLLQRCGGCGRLRWPPREPCGVCGSTDATWVAATGTGTIASWTVSHRAAPGVLVPFVVVLVRLDDQEDIFVPGYVEGPGDGAALAIGQGVAVGFDPPTGASATRRLRWRRTDPPRSA